MKPLFLKKNYFFLLLPVNILVVFFTIVPKGELEGNVPKWLLVAVLSHAAIAPFFFSQLNIMISQRGARSEISALIVAGALRGVAILIACSYLDLPSTHPLVLRPLNSAITVPLWFIALHYILDTRRLFHQQFHERYVNFINRLLDDLSESQELKRNREALERELNETLEPLRLTLETVAGKELTSEELAQESKLISNFIEDRIRPLSHKMWDQAKASPPKLNFSHLIRLSLFELSLPFGWIILPTFIYQLVSATTIFGFPAAFDRAFVGMGILTILFLLYRLAYKYSFGSIVILNLISLLITFTLPNLLIRTIFFPFIHPRSNFQLEFVNLLWYSTMLIATSLAFGLKNYQERILGVFDLYLLDEKRHDHLDRLAFIHKQKYARYIHADIQSALVASSIELSRAAETEDIELGKAAIERAAQLLRRDHRKYAVGKAVDPRERFGEIVKSWSGIAEISIENLELILGSAQTSVLVSEILEELIANSVRHGNAQRISITISQAANNIDVTYFDDGLLNTSKYRGLGSKILNEKAQSWTSDVFSNQNRVRFVVPLWGLPD